MSEPMRQHPATYTYTDLLTWPEDERWELIDGIPYNMTPAPSRRHQEILGALYLQFGAFLRHAPCRVYLAPFDVRLPKADEDSMTASTVVQPDLTVICEREKLDQRGAVGSPALVVEILSPYTAKKDRQRKMQRYAQAAIPEYWIISPTEQTVEVYQLHELGRYGAATVYQYDEQVPVSVLPGLLIDLGQVFVEDEEEGAR
jgi:Uma2 family endonuclease